MTLTEFASIAEIVAAIGVIVSLLVVAWEIRKNTAQSRQANWGWLVDRFSSVYAQTDDLALADLVARGRQSFHGLSEGEKIAFGHYLEQMCIANDGLLVFSRSEVYGHEEMMALFEKHMRFHLGFPGAREWWEQFQVERGFPRKPRKQSIVQSRNPFSEACGSPPNNWMQLTGKGDVRVRPVPGIRSEGTLALRSWAHRG